MATIGTSDLGLLEEVYGEWLGYAVVERGEIEDPLARSWGLPGMAMRPYVLLQPASGADVFLRAALIDPAPGYRGLTTFGWGAFELIVEDVYALHARLASSPFRVIGPPQSLGGDLERIHAMQVVGPAEEVLYLTCDTGPRSDSILPRAGAFVGRLFIPIVAGPSVETLQDFYYKRFGVARREVRNTRTKVINDALELEETTKTPMTYAPLGLAGNFLQLDEYPPPAGRRPHASGQLPPGNAGVAFAVEHLGSLTEQPFSEPTRSACLAYGSKQSLALWGPAGELVELIDETG